MELFQKIGLVIDIPILIAGVAFFTVFLLFMGFRQSALRRIKKRKLIQKIQRIEGPLQTDYLSSSNPLEHTASRPVMKFLAGLGKRVASEKSTDYSASRMMFLRAGTPQ